MRGATRIALAAVALCAASGCARNGALELSLDLPPADESRQMRFASIQLRRADALEDPFVADWDTDTALTVSLDDTARSQAELSVLSESFDGDVLVRVRFCSVATCDGLIPGTGSDPLAEVQLRLSDPIYRGHVTSYTGRVAGIPPEMAASGCAMLMGAPRPTMRCDVGRCAIAGCVDGAPTSFCDGDVHFCDR